MIKRNLPLMITIGVFVLGYRHFPTHAPGQQSMYPITQKETTILTWIPERQ